MQKFRFFGNAITFFDDQFYEKNDFAGYAAGAAGARAVGEIEQLTRNRYGYRGNGIVEISDNASFEKIIFAAEVEDGFWAKMEVAANQMWARYPTGFNGTIFAG